MEVPTNGCTQLLTHGGARSSFRQIAKEVLPTTSRSMVVYQYMCSCKLTYVGKTSQKITERMTQHVPDKLIDGDLTHTKSESAITRHLKDSAECVPNDQKEFVRVLQLF